MSTIAVHDERLLEVLQNKHSIQVMRKEALQKIYEVAPTWADSIKNRIGIHGADQVPENIDDAWKWKQLNQVLLEITELPFDELQRKSIELSKSYQKEKY